jgi:hypothetical protein
MNNFDGRKNISSADIVDIDEYQCENNNTDDMNGKTQDKMNSNNADFTKQEVTILKGESPSKDFLKKDEQVHQGKPMGEEPQKKEEEKKLTTEPKEDDVTTTSKVEQSRAK